MQKQRSKEKKKNDNIRHKKFKDYVLLTYEAATIGEDQEQWYEGSKKKKKHIRKIVEGIRCNFTAKRNKLLSNRWVFKVKEHGKYKVRVLVRGCKQKPGLNYEETVSAVVNITSSRILFALAKS